MILSHFFKMNWLVVHSVCWCRMCVLMTLRKRYCSGMSLMGILIQTIHIILSQIPSEVYNIFWRGSSVKINLKTISNELFVILTHFYSRLKKLINGCCHYLFIQNVIIFFLPWSVSINQFKSYHSNCPYITLVRISVKLQWLRRHVKRWSNIVIKFLATSFILNCKPKISQNRFPFAYKNVCKFQISMNHSEAVQLSIAFKKLLHYALWLWLTWFKKIITRRFFFFWEF